jgi:hypothetical protein
MSLPKDGKATKSGFNILSESLEKILKDLLNTSVSAIGLNAFTMLDLICTHNNPMGKILSFSLHR